VNKFMLLTIIFFINKKVLYIKKIFGMFELVYKAKEKTNIKTLE